MENGKSIKECAKEAKKRLKTGFWQNYKKDLNFAKQKAETDGVEKSKVAEYYSERIKSNLTKSNDSEETFYQKVKKLLDEYGEVPDILRRLTDKTEYDRLSYEDKQRYNLSLSNKYLNALARYKKEKELKVN